MIRKLIFLTVFIVGFIHFCFSGDVVINEISYHPVDDAPSEFIELYNKSDKTVDLSDVHFSRGIEFIFPQGTLLNAKTYILVVQDINNSAWRNLNKVGPYSGTLSNGGETVELVDSQTQVIDSFKYADASPWPRAADGEGYTLERISPDLPSKDYHSWRASEAKNGSPGKANSVINIPPYPMIQSFQINPSHPKSGDKVDISVTLDGIELIDQVICHYESQTIKDQGDHITKTMTPGEQTETSGVFLYTLPAMPNQTLVRVSLEIVLTDGKPRSAASLGRCKTI